jgi:hypothetical protein
VAKAPQLPYTEKFKVQGSKFKVKRKGRHKFFMLYGWAKVHE